MLKCNKDTKEKYPFCRHSPFTHRHNLPPYRYSAVYLSLFDPELAHIGYGGKLIYSMSALRLFHDLDDPRRHLAAVETQQEHLFLHVGE